MFEHIDPFSDNDIDQLFEDALLDDLIGNNINNDTAMNYVPQVTLFPAVGPPTKHMPGGARLALADESWGH